MDRRSILNLLAGAPALAALPPLPVFAATNTEADGVTRAVASKILSKYRGDAAFRALVQKSPIQALRQTGMRGSVAARVLEYELGVTAAACGNTGGCLTKAGAVSAACVDQKNALTKGALTKGALTKAAPAFEVGFEPIAICALTFGGSPPADFAAHAGLPSPTDAKGWRALIATLQGN